MSRIPRVHHEGEERVPRDHAETLDEHARTKRPDLRGGAEEVAGQPPAPDGEPSVGDRIERGHEYEGGTTGSVRGVSSRPVRKPRRC